MNHYLNYFQSYYVTLAIVLFAYMSLYFVYSLIKKRNDVADVAWGLGFVVMAWMSFVLSVDAGMRALLVDCLVSIWGLRLASHISRRHKDKPEDYRYLAWRKEWGKWFFLRSYLQVFLLQGALLFVIVSPVLIINLNAGNSFGLFDVLGLAVWLVGFYFESVGDTQLAAFIGNPENKGKLMQSGLWRFSRHPNYFGEVTQWWGLFIIALSVPYGYFGIIGPLMITFLILKVSGVPLLENKMAENPDFAEYKKRTSVFLPLPPRI